MKKLLCTLSACVLMAAGAQALVINFTEVDPDTGTVNVGTLAAGQTLGDGDAFTSLSYTVSGLDIEEDGSANDSITVTFSVGVLGGTTIDWDVIEIDHDDATFKDAGEGISFGTIGVTGVLGTSGGSLVVNSAKYTEWTFRRWAASVDEVVSIDGDGAAYNYSDASSAVALDDTAFSITHVSGGSWNGDDFDFTVDVSAGGGGGSSLPLIDDDFSTGAFSTDLKFTNAEIDAGWHKRSSNGPDWSIVGGVLTNSAFVANDEKPAFLLNTVSSADTSLTQIAVSFDYTIGAGSTLFFHSALMVGATNGTLNAGVSNSDGLYAGDQFITGFAGGGVNLKDGSTPVAADANAIISFAGSTSGTFSQTFDISGYTGISSIADVSHILAVFASDNDLSGGAITIDNLTLTAVSGGSPGSPSLSLIGFTSE